jgi:hypothetical protein
MPLDTRLPLLASQFKPITYQAPSQANMLAEVAQAASAMQGLQRNAMAMREAEQERAASSGVAEIIRKAQGQELSPEMLDQMADALAGMPKFLGKSAEMKQAAAQMRSMRAALGQTTVEPLAGMGGAPSAPVDATQQRYGQVNLLPLLSLGTEGQKAADLLLKQNELRQGARPFAIEGNLISPSGQILYQSTKKPPEPTETERLLDRWASMTPEQRDEFSAFMRAKSGAAVAEPKDTRSPEAKLLDDFGLERNPANLRIIKQAMEKPASASGDAALLAEMGQPVTFENLQKLADARKGTKEPATERLSPEAQMLKDFALERTPENLALLESAKRKPETMSALQKAQAERKRMTAAGLQGSQEFAENEQLIKNLLADPAAMTAAQIKANEIAQARVDLETARVNNDRAGVLQAERRLRILEQEAAQRADPAFQARMAAAQAAGTATGRAQVERASQATEIAGVIAELEQAVKPGGLIDRSTGSGAGALADVAAGFVGIGTPGAVAIGKLQPIADMVLKIVPRFEGPQSDKDTASYKEAAGKLADPTTPNNIRRAAANEILRILRDRKGRLGSSVVSFDSAATAPTAPAAAQTGPAAPRAPATPAAAPAQGNRREIAPGVFVTERP